MSSFSSRRSTVRRGSWALPPHGVKRLAIRQRRQREIRHPRRRESLDDLGVGAERTDLVAQDQVVAHAGARAFPHAVDVLGAWWLVVEMDEAVVAPAGAGTLQHVDRPERTSEIAGSEAQILVIPWPVL